MRRFTLPNGLCFEYDDRRGDAYAALVKAIVLELYEANENGLGSKGSKVPTQQRIADRHEVSVRMVKRLKKRLIDQAAIRPHRRKRHRRKKGR